MSVNLAKVPVDKVTEKMFLENKKGKKAISKKKNADNFFASKPSDVQFIYFKFDRNKLKNKRKKTLKEKRKTLNYRMKLIKLY